jgi:hypothetical protein
MDPLKKTEASVRGRMDEALWLFSVFARPLAGTPGGPQAAANRPIGMVL